MPEPQPQLPPAVEDIVDQLAQAGGVVAVVLGGSRGQGVAHAASDWDLGLYYRGALDLTSVAKLGAVHPPGSWGRVMNGGAWFERGALAIDVLFRDLDFVERCIARAREGDYDVEALLGYVAGVPTYSLMAEAATCRVLRGGIDPPGAFPERLAERAPDRWRFHRDFSLRYARALARRGDLVPAVGQIARAVLEEAHARLCHARQWTLNEKRLVDAAGLAWAHEWVIRPPVSGAALLDWIDQMALRLGPGDRDAEREPPY